MQISEQGVLLIKTSEGFAAHVYDDNGKPAIGYGHDLLEGESYPDGITQDEATVLLLADVSKLEAWLNTNIPADCTQGQFDALCDFGYNLGLGSLKTMLGHGWDQVPQQIPRWNNVNKQPSAGLTARRAAEVALWEQA